MYDFQSRMAEGRDAAKRLRDRSSSSPFEAFATERQRFASMSDDDWHARCADEEDYAREIEEGPAVDATGPSDHHVKPRRQHAMPAKQPKPTLGSRQLSPLLGGASMTGAMYRKLLAKLDLSPEHAGPKLGISRRTSYRYAQDELPIPVTVAKLLRAMVKLGTTEI